MLHKTNFRMTYCVATFLHKHKNASTHNEKLASMVTLFSYILILIKHLTVCPMKNCFSVLYSMVLKVSY